VLSEELTISHGFRQGCNLLPTLFNIYINEIIVKWKLIYTKVISLSTSTKRNTFIFADDYVIIADSDYNLLGGVFTLQITTKMLEWKYYQKNLRRWHFEDKTK